MDSATTREQLERAGSLHGVHWVVIVLSLCLTLVAWQVTRNQVAEKAEQRFLRQAEQTVNLISERMQKYEDALWAGVAFIDAAGGSVDRATWRRYAESLQIERKYPGINGIGVILAVPRDGLDAHLAAERRHMPDYRVHPVHAQPELLPIVYIEPQAANGPAVGLDVAHETNRYQAARAARESGETRATGPIVLVQDQQRTPGFLLYAPFFTRQPAGEPVFAGMVYAPFVVRQLMLGTLDLKQRHVGLRITDGDSVLFDDLPARGGGAFSYRQVLAIHGRTWTVDVAPTATFLASQGSAQPLTILIAGLLVEGLLVLLFLKITQANRRAIRLADSMATELTGKAEALETRNRELEQFAYVASHDLQEPLRTVATFSEMLDDECRDQLNPSAQRWLTFIHEAARRSQHLVRDLLDYSRSSAEALNPEPVDLGTMCRKVAAGLDPDGRLPADTLSIGSLPSVDGDPTQLQQLFQNLFSNALKFSHPERPPRVVVEGGLYGDQVEVRVRDNGIGIPDGQQERVFAIFQRLHKRSEYDGTGIGLAICQRVVERHGGSIRVESSPGAGSTFVINLPAPQPVQQRQAA